MQQPTIQDLMNLLPEFFQPQQAAGVNAVIVFELSGDKGGDWTVSIHDQTCTVINEISSPSDLSLTADGQDVLDIICGRMDPLRAYMMGKLRMTGSMGLAMELTKLFKIDRNRLDQLRTGDY